MDFERHAWNRVRKLEDELFEREVTTLTIAAGGQEQELPFDSLVGFTVKGNEDAYWMETPKDRPTNEYLLTYGNNLLVAYYSDVAGKLDKPVLIVEPTEFPHPSISGEKLCAVPLFSAKYADYNCVFYVFEDTSDTLGLGLTVPKGWYAVNSTTFALTPLDINECPVIFPGEFIRNGDVVDDWIKDNSTYKGEFSFVAGEKHCIWMNNDSFYVLKYPQLYAFTNSALATFALFMVIRGEVHPLYYDVTLSKTTSTIDPKFLPDSTVGEEVWGDVVQAAIITAVSSGKDTKTFNWTAEELASVQEQLLDADKVRFALGDVFVECPITMKSVTETTGGQVKQIGFSSIVSINGTLFDLRGLVNFDADPVTITAVADAVTWPTP